jgi:hypothetical protein
MGSKRIGVWVFAFFNANCAVLLLAGVHECDVVSIASDTTLRQADMQLIATIMKLNVIHATSMHRRDVIAVKVRVLIGSFLCLYFSDVCPILS